MANDADAKHADLWREVCLLVKPFQRKGERVLPALKRLLPATNIPELPRCQICGHLESDHRPAAPCVACILCWEFRAP